MIGAAIGAVVDAGTQVYKGVKSGKSFTEAVKSIDGKSVATSAALGALTGGASSLGKAAITGTLKVAGEKVAINGAARVAVGTQGALVGAGAKLATDSHISNQTGGEVNSVESAVKGVVKTFVPLGDKIVEQGQKLIESALEQPQPEVEEENN